MLFGQPYIHDAASGNVDSMRASLDGLYKITRRQNKFHPYQKLIFRPEEQESALHAAIQHHQFDVVLLLLTYEKINLLQEKHKLEGIRLAIQHQAHGICLLLIKHLKQITPPTYNLIKQQLKHHFSNKPLSDITKNSITEIIITLLKHPHLTPHPRRALETLRDIGILCGCVELIQYLMDHGLDIESLPVNEQALIAMTLSESEHGTLLLSAFKIFKFLINHRIALDNFDTPFIAAARCHNLALMKAIYSEYPNELSRQNRDRETALMVAAKSNSPAKATIVWLLEKSEGLDVTQSIDGQANILETIAANPAQPDAFEFLMSHPDTAIDTFLQDTLKHKHLVTLVVNAIIERQRNMEARAIPFALLTPLLALYHRSIDKNNKLSPNAMHARYFQHQNLTPWVMQAPLNRRSKLFSCLFTNATQMRDSNRYRIIPIDDKDHLGQTALHHLMRNIPQQIISALTPSINQPTQRNIKTLAFIHQLITLFNIDAALITLNKLLSYHASIDMPDEKGTTPLHLACMFHSAPMIEALLKHGANPNHPDCFGATPLMLACRHLPMNCVSLLLKYEANPHLTDARGRTIVDYLSENTLEIPPEDREYLHALALSQSTSAGLAF